MNHTKTIISLVILWPTLILADQYMAMMPRSSSIHVETMNAFLSFFGAILTVAVPAEILCHVFKIGESK